MSEKRKAQSELPRIGSSFIRGCSSASPQGKGADIGARDYLHKFFPHHSGFKDGQEEVISALLRGNNAAAIFPTGGGKSLCYQLPGLALADEGMTLVISPLLALMKDQVDAARSRNHPVDLLASSLTLSEKIEVTRRIRNRQTAILYVAPEQLNNEASVALIRSTPLALIAIDEAHCISEWGNAFRPDYLRLANLCREWKVPRTVALTATATPKVAQDICDGFDIKPQNCIRTPFFRPNLKFCFTPISTEAERHKELIAAVLRQPPGSAIIVYATAQKTTQVLSSVLDQLEGCEARPYHAGLTQDVRKVTQDWFMESSTNSSSTSTPRKIVAATIAFGMGIDKSDIRCIIHYNLPKSLEGYAQEIGRAGRDGNDSHCQMLVCPDDVALLEAFAYCGSPSQRAIKGVLRDFFSQPKGSLYPVGTERPISFFSLGRPHDMAEPAVRMLVAFLDIHHGLTHQGTPQYGLYKLKARDGRPANALSGIFDSCGDPAAAKVLNRLTVVRQKWVHIDVSSANKALEGESVPRERLVLALSRLEQNNEIELVPSQVEHVFTIAQKPENLTELARIEYERFQARESQELGRIEQVLSFVAADECHAKLLTEYFEGSDGPSFSQDKFSFPCGQCPRCTSGSALVLPERSDCNLDLGFWERLMGEPSLPLDDPKLITRFVLGFKSPRITQLKLDKSKNFGFKEGAPYKLVEEVIRTRLCPDSS